jgi:hypothetical protein
MFTSCFAHCCSRFAARRVHTSHSDVATTGMDSKQTLQTKSFPAESESEMQTVIQVITSGRGSLREKIMTDPQLRRFDLLPTEHQRPGRPHGWAKIHSETAHGAINLEWHGRTGVLTCRVVTKLGHKPHSIIGDFIDYLLARHQSRILAIHIMRR